MEIFIRCGFCAAFLSICSWRDYVNIVPILINTFPAHCCRVSLVGERLPREFAHYYIYESNQVRQFPNVANSRRCRCEKRQQLKLQFYKSPRRAAWQCEMSVTLHTNYGDIKLELQCELCPRTCENFLALCASGYYTNCIFHRNIKGFIVQTGDPSGTGKGGTSIWGGKFEDEFRTELMHDGRGVVSMANSGPDSNGSQFFITYDKHPQLDLKNTIFARVIDGLDTLDELGRVPVNDKFRPLASIVIESVTIHANPIAERLNPAKSFLPTLFPRHFATLDEPLASGTSEQINDNVNDDTETERYYAPVGEVSYARRRLAKPIARPFSVPLDEPDTRTHVLSLTTLHTFLKSEGCMDICAMSHGGGVYVIVCTVHNERHAWTVAVRCRRLYNSRLKSARDSDVDNYAGIRVSARRGDTSGWNTIDMGDVLVHVMRKSIREKYNLESLWLLGPEYEKLSEKAAASIGEADRADSMDSLHEDDRRIMEQWLKKLAEQNTG